MNWTRIFREVDPQSDSLSVHRDNDGETLSLLARGGTALVTRADVARLHAILGEWLGVPETGAALAPSAAVVTARAVARDRAREAVAVGASPQTAAWFALERALDDVDGTLREATDAELAAVTRALIGDLK